jgi:hypothetical protein
MFNSGVVQYQKGRVYIGIYINNLSSSRPLQHLMDITILALELEFKVTNMGQFHGLLEIQIIFSCNLIELSDKAFIDKILEQFQMNDSHPTLLPFTPNTRFKKSDSVLEVEQ